MPKTICPICCDEFDYQAYTDCDHYTCTKCLLIQKILCRCDKCLLCGKQKPKTIIAPVSMQIYSFRQYIAKNYLRPHYRYQVLVHPAAFLFVEQLENPPCPGCGTQFASFYEMSLHMSEKHKRYYCRICIKHKPVFYIDYVLYDNSFIYQHLQQHPACQLCAQRQYDQQALYDHYKIGHVRCEICRTFGIHESFWEDYHALQQHVKDAHFACTFRQCNAEGYGFASEEEQLEHLIEVHYNYVEPSHLVEMKTHLNYLRRYKKLVDLLKIEEMRKQFSIENRAPYQSQQRKYTKQHEEQNDLYIQDYIANLVTKKKKDHGRQEQHADVDTYVEYVEPDQYQEKEYRGIYKQAVGLIDLSSADSPGAIFYHSYTKTSYLDDIFAGDGFRVVKQKKSKAEVYHEEQVREVVLQGNDALLHGNMLDEFAETKSVSVRKIVETQMPKKAEPTVQPVQSVPGQILEIKRVKNKKASKNSYPQTAEEAQDEAFVPLFDVAVDSYMNSLNAYGYETQAALFEVPEKKSKFINATGYQENQKQKTAPTFFMVQSSAEYTKYVQYATVFDAKDVYKNTIPESHVDGDLQIKVCKQKQKKQKEYIENYDVPELEMKLLFDVSVPAPVYYVKYPKKQLFNMYGNQNTAYQSIYPDIAAKDVYKNTVPESHVNGELEFKICKDKSKKAKQNTQPNTAYANPQEAVPDAKDAEIVVVPAKKTKNIYHYYQESTELLLDLKMTDEELQQLTYYKQYLVQATNSKDSELLVKNTNDIYMQVTEIFNYIPAEIAIARVVNGELAMQFQMVFGYTEHFISQLKAMYLTFPNQQRELIFNRMVYYNRPLFDNYAANSSDFLVDSFSDFYRARYCVYQVIWGMSYQASDLPKLYSACTLKIVKVCEKNRNFTLHFVGNVPLDRGLAIMDYHFGVQVSGGNAFAFNLQSASAAPLDNVMSAAQAAIH